MAHRQRIQAPGNVDATHTFERGARNLIQIKFNWKTKRNAIYIPLNYLRFVGTPIELRLPRGSERQGAKNITSAYRQTQPLQKLNTVTSANIYTHYPDPK